MLKDVLKKFKNNHKIIMLKWTICDDVITDLVWFNHEIITMFLNSLKFMNVSEDSVIFAYTYCKTLIDFVKVYEKKSHYLLLNLNTETLFCQSLTLLKQMQIMITNLAAKWHNSDHQIRFFKSIKIFKILNHVSHVEDVETDTKMKKENAVKKTEMKDYKSLITEEIINVWLNHASHQQWRLSQQVFENIFMRFTVS